MISAAELIGLVTIRGAEEGALKLARVGESADSAGAKLAGLAVGGTVLAAAGLIAIGAAAVKMDADLQQGVNRLRTGGGDIQDTFTSLRTGIQHVAVATGELTGQLTPAMYLIVGAGERGATAMNTLAVASEGAQIEQANVADVANVVSGVMTNYGTKLYNATQYMNGLIYAVAHGKITLQDLSTAMGPIDPIAQQLGIHMQDVAAAMTTQTNAMIPATRAATGLRFMMQGLENPTKKARDEMAAMGLDSIKVAEEMKTSLPDALLMIYDAAKKAGPEGSVPFNRAISDMIGGVRGFTAFTALTGPHMQDFINNTKGIGDAMAASTTQVKGWDIAQSNLNIKLDQGRAMLEVLGQNVGEVILPYVSQLLDRVTPLIARFNDWFVSSGRLNTVLVTLGTGITSTGNALGTVIGAFTAADEKGTILRGALIALGGAFAAVKLAEFAMTVDSLVVKFGMWTKSMGGVGNALWSLIPGLTTTAGAVGETSLAIGGLELTMGPLTAIIAGIGLAVTGIVLLITHWGQVTSSVGQAVGATFSALGTSVSQSFSNMTEHITASADSMGGSVHKLQLTADQAANNIVGDGVVAARSYGAAAKQMSDAQLQAQKTIVQSAQAIQNNVSVAMDTMASNSLAAIWDVVGKAGQSFGDLAAQVGLDMQNIDDNAKSYWADVANYIEGNPIVGSVSYSTGPIAGSTGQASHHYASGTSYAPGGWSWVGEQGPELAFIPRGTQIIPHQQSERMVSGGGSSGQPVQVNIYIAGERVDQVLLPRMVQAIRDSTGVRI
jgi:TP901 family phage tail tape measure protein